MRAAFAEIVDYAGLFPPASCSMAEAVRQYDGYRRSPDRWMLGRFVVAALRLEELGAALHSEEIVIDPDDPWRLSVVMGVLVPTELGRIADFQREWEARGVLADSIEYRVSSVGQIMALDEQIPHVFRRYFEVPHTGPYHDLLKAIKDAGALAKIRTGGTLADLFPTSHELVRFLLATVKHRVQFKATAGLHHPFRGDHPLTYEPGAEQQSMHGFVNLLLATAELSRGGEGETAESILDESDRHAFHHAADAISWRDHRYTADELTTVHRQLFIGFGSCSFREPIDELGAGIAA